MLKSGELVLPDCSYSNDQPIIIPPSAPTPNHSLYLSNLDDQKLLRFSIKYFYLFTKSVSSDVLKRSLSAVLVHYYPLAGRLKSNHNDDKLHLDCNAQGALFAEASMPITAQQLLQSSNFPNNSWRNFLYKLPQPHTFFDLPPLIVQVTNLLCGGMVLCTAINHCICDGIGTSQFLHAWAHLTTKPNTTSDLPILPFHARHLLKPRNPPKSQPLVATCLTFTPSHLLHLKKQCVPSLKCTAFEALASHTWRCWVRSLDLPPTLNVKLLFSVNVRKKVRPEIPEGYYGNGFVLGCAESGVEELVRANLRHGVKLVQEGKERVDDEHVRSMIDLLEDKSVKTDLSVSLVISQWSKLGLEEVDFGEGKAMQMGPLTSDIYCLFLPLIGDSNAVRVMVSLPQPVLPKFEYFMKDYFWDHQNPHFHLHSQC
ncbi:omega-hydroxypalmitate O-feruloyl transferase [Senna tora]|uniref:Omega-hydroxypalmitate O-feruloyl transferase n=1 Tax=Senna tora TaxID=362788 RepID=A0A834WE45_9FABA|nr:omega-hydroxypalmitate O-feruloyl transferase [Senna tora]